MPDFLAYWVTGLRHLFKQVSFSVGFFQNISSLFRVLISQNFVNRSVVMLFGLVLFCTCGNIPEHIESRFVGSGGPFVCPETQVFQCRRTITEERHIFFAQHGIKFLLGPSLGVSRVSNDDHFRRSRSRFVTNSDRS